MYYKSILFLRHVLSTLLLLQCHSLFTNAEEKLPYNNDFRINRLSINSPSADFVTQIKQVKTVFRIEELFLNNVSDDFLDNAQCSDATVLYIQGTGCSDRSLAGFINRIGRRSSIGLRTLAFECSNTLHGDFIKDIDESIRELESVYILSGSIDAKHLEHFANKSNLSELCFSHSFEGFSVSHASMISRMKNLEYLVLPPTLDSYVGEDSEQQEETFLKCLDIILKNNARLNRFEGVLMPASTLAHRYKKLLFHVAEGVTFSTDEDIMSLKAFPLLEEVHIQAERMTPQLVVDSISDHSALRRLHVSDLDFNSVALSLWNAFVALEELEIQSTTLSMSHCEQIRKLIGLKKLSLVLYSDSDGLALSKSVEHLDSLTVFKMSILQNEEHPLLSGFNPDVIQRTRSLTDLELSDGGFKQRHGSVSLNAELAGIIKRSKIASLKLDFVDDRSLEAISKPAKDD